MKVGYVQFSPIFGDKNENVKKVERIISGHKADLLVLPELFATGYTFTTQDEAILLAETLYGETANFLQKISVKMDAIVVGGFVEMNNKKIFNSSIIVTKEGVKGTYRKIHLYYKEKLWFSPGDRHLEVYNINDINIGIMICFDWMFPETARTLALKGAEIIAHPANLVMPYCQKAMVTRCLENRIFAITANRIGTECRGIDEFTFTGGSQITSFNGEVLSSAPKDRDFVDIIDIDIEKARNKDLNEFNNLFDDRRKDHYFM